MFEDGEPELVANVTPGYPRSRFSVLASGVANASQMRWVVDRFLNAGYGDICVMGVMTGADDYQVLPTFWEEEVGYLAQKSSAMKSDDHTVAWQAGAGHLVFDPANAGPLVILHIKYTKRRLNDSTAHGYRAGKHVQER
jgi:hypothetical protein